LAFEEGAKEFLEHCKLIKKDAIKGFGPLAGVIKGFETVVVGGMTNAGNAIINFVSHPIQALKAGFDILLTHIKGIPAVFTTVFGAITHPINTLKTAFTGLVTASGTFAEGLAMAVTGGATRAGGALALLKGAFTKLFTVIKAHPIGVFIAVVGTLIATMIEAYNTNDEFKASITDLWENHVKPLADKFGDFVNAIMDLIDVLSKAFFTLIGFITGDVVTGWSGAFTAIWKVVEPIIAGIFDLLSAVLEILTGIIQFLTGVFTGDWEKCWTGAKKVFEGAMNGMKTIARTVIDTILGFFQKLVNGAKKALDFVKKAKNYNGTGNATINPPVIPKLATGGVIKSPTVAMIGEYAGASHNPEIVTPQSLLQSTIESSNKGIIDALIQQTKQVLVALEDVNMEVSIGDETIAQSAKRGNQSYYKRTGKPLFV
jgi:phage-related minor tail protein